jgi:hypothetical protein
MLVTYIIVHKFLDIFGREYRLRRDLSASFLALNFFFREKKKFYTHTHKKKNFIRKRGGKTVFQTTHDAAASTQITALNCFSTESD